MNVLASAGLDPSAQRSLETARVLKKLTWGGQAGAEPNGEWR